MHWDGAGFWLFLFLVSFVEIDICMRVIEFLDI
jgi:hypothetical protein